MIFYRMGKQFPITKNSETLLKSSIGVLFFAVPGRFELPYTVLQTADEATHPRYRFLQELFISRLRMQR